MSKHEKPTHGIAGEQHESQSDGPAVDPLEELEGSEELLKTGFTTGNEIKIALGVIVVLVVIFVAAVVKWMRHSGDSASKPAEEAVAKIHDKGGARGTEPAGRQEPSGFPSASRSGKSTVVAAVSGPSPGTRPKSSALEPDSWAFASDTRSKAAKHKEDSRSSLPASFEPRMRTIGSGDRAGSSAAASTSASAGGWENDTDRGLPANSPRPADPFRNRPLASGGSRDATGLAAGIRPAPGSLAPGSDKGVSHAGDLSMRSTASRAPLSLSDPNPLRNRDFGSPDTKGASSATAPGRAADADPGTRFAPRATDTGRRPDGTYVVQPNDNYWSISERLFGTGVYFQALAKHNAKKYPKEDKLQAGDVILAPTTEELEKLYPKLCPSPARRDSTENRTLTATVSSPSGGRRIYVAREGDNVYDIARQELGKAARWTEIYELNKDVLGKQSLDVAPGTQLVLPDDGPAAMSHRNDPGSRR